MGPEGIGLIKFNPVPLSVVLVGGPWRTYSSWRCDFIHGFSMSYLCERSDADSDGYRGDRGERGVALAGHIWRTAAMNSQVVGFVSESPVDVDKQISRRWM